MGDPATVELEEDATGTAAMMQVRPTKSTSIERNISFFNEAKPLSLPGTETEEQMSTTCWMR